MRYLIAASTATATAVVAFAPAPAQAKTVCGEAYGVRAAVVHKHGKRAPGRNICRFGIKHSGGKVVPAKYAQKVRYLAQLRVLNRPDVAAVPPAQKPGGALSASVSLPYPGPNGTRWAIPWYIVACESGGSWTALNASGAAGPYQIMPEHGRSWPANPADHHAIAARLWAGGAGAGNWVCA